MGLSGEPPCTGVQWGSVVSHGALGLSGEWGLVIIFCARRCFYLQALACAQVLCGCSQKMARALMKGNIHILLFMLLYKDVGEEGSTVGAETEHLPRGCTGSNDWLVSGQHFSSDDKDKVQECKC